MNNIRPPMSATDDVLTEVLVERARQKGKWGEQDHRPEIWLTILGEEVGEANRAALEAWAVLSAGDTRGKWLVWMRRLREELVQVAAVAVAAVESLDRNELGGGDNA